MTYEERIELARQRRADLKAFTEKLLSDKTAATKYLRSIGIKPNSLPKKKK
jgi:hypothetical protein